jgi:hypothetical protein
MKRDLQVDDEKWTIDESEVDKIFLYYAISRAREENTKVIKTRDHWKQVIRLYGAGAEVRQNHGKIAGDREKYYNQKLMQWKTALEEDMSLAQFFLISTRREADFYSRKLIANFKTAQEINAEALSHAKMLTTTGEILQQIGIVGLSVIAVIGVSGATVTIATVGGAAVEGFSRYQTTGSLKKSAASAGFFVAGVWLSKATVIQQASKISASISVVVELTKDTSELMIVSDAQSGGIRPLIPTASGHPFRFDSASDSGAFGHP